ncbi:phosphoribosyl-AMP cyclohydrolase [Candidatus Vidania fulgoroideorum]
MIKKLFLWKKKILPCITQSKKRVLSLTWINKCCFFKCLRFKISFFWSRSRGQEWLKGESSKNYQFVKKIFIDCDNDSLLIKVNQLNNICCHLLKKTCFTNEIY